MESGKAAEKLEKPSLGDVGAVEASAEASPVSLAGRSEVGHGRLELGDVMGDVEDMVADDPSTAEIAANAPRYRRKSSTFIDGIHDVPEDQDMAPAQLYSTMSGRLFHSGRIAIVMVGLPARGKT
jgi:hypothetical protein